MGLTASLGPGTHTDPQTGRETLVLSQPSSSVGFETAELFWYRVYVAACRQGLGARKPADPPIHNAAARRSSGVARHTQPLLPSSRLPNVTFVGGPGPPSVTLVSDLSRKVHEATDGQVHVDHGA